MRTPHILPSPSVPHDFASNVSADLQTMIDINHYLLVALGVGHPTLETLCTISARNGFHSKLTGAGGGGCALTLVPEGMSSHRHLVSKHAQGAVDLENPTGYATIIRSLLLAPLRLTAALLCRL